MDVENIFVAENESTFQYEDSLPSLPVPPLNQTLAKYLDSVRPFVNDKEYSYTKKLVEDFENGIGKELHSKLQQKANKMRNWLETWWEDYAYLTTRQPLIPCSNFAGTVRLEPTNEWTPAKLQQTTSAAWKTYFSVKFWNLLRREKLKPDKPRGQPWSMAQYKRMFSTYRIPGEMRDTLVTKFVTDKQGPPNSNYIIVLCRGHIFKVVIMDSQYQPFTVPELEQLFRYVDKESQQEYGQAISALTSDERARWAKNRNYLMELHPDNKKNLALIENAIQFLILDQVSPESDDDFALNGIGGDTRNRWADSFNNIIFKNGVGIGNADHTPFDGIIAGVYDYFVFLHVMKYKGKWQGSTHIRNVPVPEELVFHVDRRVELAIETAITTAKNLINDVAILRTKYKTFGKQFITANKMNPDTFVQECLQLAYYRTHNKAAPTYETATTRAFYHGRTETVRSCTVQAIEWAKSMLDPSTSKEQRIRLLKTAMTKHETLMTEAKRNEGCDRHLLGLYILCLESGQPIPQIFTDFSWMKSGGGGNFILSTSLNGYMPTVGAVTAMCQDGYGVFYSILPNQINFCVTSWKSSKETDVQRFYAAIEQSLHDTQHLFINSSL